MLQKRSFINKFYCKCKLSLRSFSIRPDYCTYSGPCKQTRSRPSKLLYFVLTTGTEAEFYGI